MDDGIVIVGGGLAAQRCAETLRRLGHEARLRIVCAEPAAPYDRPPLSKSVLADADAEAHLSYRPPDWYAEQHIELLLGVAAVGLDGVERTVSLADGRVLAFEQLLIATGSRPRRLAVLDRFVNVHALRTVADARALRAALAEGGRLVVVGAGFIGQEVAAAAARAGVHTTIVEAAEAPLAAMFGPAVGSWFTELLRSEGVEILLGTTVAAAHGAGSVERVTLSDGRTLPCDHVVIGVGVDPDVDWLGDGGLGPVRADGQTRSGGVFAAGDVTGAGHWESAARQGVAAARAMLGLEPARMTPAGFWSDLYGTRVQYVGNAPTADGATIDGDPSARNFRVTFTRQGRAVGVLLVGRPHELPNARALLAA